MGNSLLARLGVKGRRAPLAAADPEDTEDEEAASAAAEDGEDDDAAAAEGDDDEDPDAEDGDGEGDDREKDTPAEAKARRSGRKAERRRWASVFGHKSVAGREAAAVEILSSTDLSAKDAVKLLGKLPGGDVAAAGGKGGAAGFATRMRGQRPAAIGAGGDGGEPKAGQRLADRIAARDKQVGARRSGRNGG